MWANGRPGASRARPPQSCARHSSSKAFVVVRRWLGLDARIEADQAGSSLRLQTIVRLRWFAVLGQLLAVSIVQVGFGFEFPIGLCMLLISASAWLNVFLRVRYPARYRLGATFATGLLAYDILQLVALLFLTGGIENPFVVLIVAPVTVSAATLPLRNTVLLGGLALVSTGLLIADHWPVPWFATEILTLPTIYKLGQFAAVAATMVFLALYVWRLSKESRQMSAALTATELVLAREQKLHALDGLAAAAAHELGTPLATIVLVASELQRDVSPGTPLAEDVALLRGQAERCREILQKLTRQPSEQDPLHATLSVSQLLDESAEAYRTATVAIEIASGPAEGTAGPAVDEPVGERRPGLIYGIGNLIENAVDFAESKVEISARWDDRSLDIEVRDDGPGFQLEVLDTLGEPYVTTRRSGTGGADKRAAGLGLGFFIAKTLLERSGASLTLDNRQPPEQGAIVRISWPRDTFEAAPQPAPAPGNSAAALNS
ncbi:MAG: ActS/PrrB/RegB family redox-sensitive histidine kinase [Hyphomicrobiaceae bacterium]|nr:ActS/PrrB/RegB family redox-sensitive histidine kinase [Hyphomicrobiaceae bacterium]